MEETQKQILYTAFKPTGDLQLGNYLGVLRRLVEYQNDYNCIYTVADMHSLTVACEPSDLRRRSYDFMALFMAIGLDPEKCVLFVQSHVPAHAELTWILNCNTMMGEASRMTQFKDKSKKAGKAGINVGLFDYPVLMASDILLYQANVVPVGKDQVQHLELARDVAERFNTRYSPTFTVPEPLVSKATAKIYNLTDPTTKMGKTDDNTDGVVFILDDEDTIMRKFKRAVTDSGNEIRYAADKPGVSNLISIYSAVTGKSRREVESEWASGNGYAGFKQSVGEAVVEHLRPVRENYRRLISDKAELERLMKIGAEKAAYIARKTLSKVYRKVGFVTV